jgi:hypothetical protein
MTEEEKKERELHWERYLAAAHAVQSGVKQLMELKHNYGSPKHTRTGVDMQKAEQGGLAKLLIDKGVFTELEYFKAMADAMEREKEEFERELSVLMKANVKLA